MLICALSSSVFCFSFSARSSCAFVVSFPAVATRSNNASALPNSSAASWAPALPSSAVRRQAALGAAGRPPCAPHLRPFGPSRRAPSPRAPGCLSCPDGLSCPGGRPHGLGISSLFKPGYFQREVMGGALEDRDGLGVDLCLGRRLGPLLRNARAQSALRQRSQRDSGAAHVVCSKNNKRESATAKATRPCGCHHTAAGYSLSSPSRAPTSDRPWCVVGRCQPETALTWRLRAPRTGD